ncbi:fatty acyl-AMP ligase [Mycobacterium sp. ITM-2016-00317]|uniref:fatty acyl-AMP ligase n=1 Tax=Mycobacterium sp. ITM-2016-00317 TaxID=2099694 RepID=UPI00287FD36E|nr:fatty acyl-AMP ligase [Mycobacterium sp. ITM-2016-00317]WNG85289.1 fatty acyl-AMP ligase [Mycobacterium sp. ITM-2016-00317]
MDRDTAQDVPEGLLRIEDCLDAEGGIVLPPGVTLISLIDRNIAHVGDTVAFRYLDFSGPAGTRAVELTWSELGVRMRAIGAHLQQVTRRGDRVAVLAPQGLEYVAGFFGAVKAGNVAVPLFAPELPGHAERLDVALRDSRPSAVLTTVAARRSVEDFLATMEDADRPTVIVIDEIPDAAAADFVPVTIDVDDVSHLQYTGGATRSPVGVEITHRAVGTNLLQMILSIDLLDRNTHGVSWLPLYHDMGLSMIGFPAVYGGHSTLMSPTAFIRRPLRWIEALSAGARTGRVVTAAPNFAYEWAAQRGVPGEGSDIELGNNVVLIIGSEPVSIGAINTFTAAFAPYGLPRTAFKPSYGLAEATLFVSTIAPAAEPTAVHVDRARLTEGCVVPVAADDERAVTHVSCGQVARSLWAVIVDDNGAETPDGRVGEIWLQGDNIGRGYWGMPEQTRATFHARLSATLPEGSHAAGADVGRKWLRTGDLGFYLDGELYVCGRTADQLCIDGCSHYPHDIEATVAAASPVVRRGYVAAFIVDAGVVVVAERAAGTARADTAAAIEAVRSAVRQRHGVPVADVRVVPAGAIPRTTSGKLARRACRAEYLRGGFD